MSPTDQCKADKSVRDVLIAMLNAQEPDRPSTPFRQVVGRLIAQAAAGEWQAMKEIFDRIDGTPKPQMEAKTEPRIVLLNTGVPWPRDQDGI